MTLASVLDAESVAIVGASKAETKRGFQAIKILLDEKFTGKIYPVNPKEKKILGLPCYAKVSDIPDPVELALLTTPAASIPGILEDCGEKGVKGAIIIAGGFGETGTDGKELEEKFMQVARKHNIRIIGPNTSGMMNLKTRLNMVGIRDAPAGDIALLSQSGNMALTLITEARLKSRKGFSYYVGVGNEADIQFHEYLEYFRQDPDTRAIVLYVEGLRHGREFLQQAYKTTIEKPVILLKSGRSSRGRESAGSHTGALAGISEVAKTAFERAGIITIEKSDALFPVAESLSSLPPIKNNSVAILADGGGHATIAADLLTDLGVQIPELNDKTKEKLKNILPDAASIRNPVDVAGGTDSDPTLFADCANILLQDSNIGGLLIVGLFGGYGIRFTEHLALLEEDAAHRMGHILRKRKKPIIVHSLFSSVKPHSLDLLRYYNIPVYDSLDIACRCIGALDEYGRYLGAYHGMVNFVFNWGGKATEEGLQIFKTARKEKRDALLEPEAKRLLALHGAPVQEDRLAKTPEEAIKLASRHDGGVVLKIVSPNILHKTDAGGVWTNLHDEEAIRKAFTSIMKSAKKYNPTAEIRGILVSPMANSGTEVIIGTKLDDQFGPVIMCGLGGIFVEVLKDVTFRVLPISPTSAKKMIQETKSYPLLEGIRSTPPKDIKALRRLLLLCSELIESYPDILEMDLNPVIVHQKGLSIVDARILLKPG